MRRPAVASVTVLSLASLSFIACEPANSRSAEPVVRDSAGVRIIENDASRWAEGEGWRLSERPLLDIGADSDEAAYQLFRVTGALKLDDGAIVIANSGTGELRYFDADGVYLRSSGRQGSGPGEFQSISTIGTLVDGSLVAYDGRQKRISIFAPDGVFVSSSRIETSDHPGFHTAAAFLDDNTLLVSAEGLLTRGELASRVRRDTTYYIRCETTGAVLDTIAALPGREMYIMMEGEHVDMAQLAFGREPHFAAYLAGAYFGNSDAFEIRYLDSDGELARIIRMRTPTREVSDDDIELFLSRQLGDMPEGPDRQFMENFYSGMPFPETMPAHGNLIVDSDGNLWVEEYHWPLDEPARWKIFDSAGALLGVVETPPGLEIYQIGSDFVLGRWRDAMDIEHIQMFGLTRS
jgi:hypothetical protein